MKEPVKYAALISGYAIRKITEKLGRVGDTDQTQQIRKGKWQVQEESRKKTKNWLEAENPKVTVKKCNGNGTENHTSNLNQDNTTGFSTDMVNHPPHYASSKIECIDAMEAMTSQDRNYNTFLNGHQMYLWQVIFKYIWRFPFKEKPIEDLEKAQFYIKRLIDKLENTK